MHNKDSQPQKEPEDLHRAQVNANILLPVLLTVVFCLIGFIVLLWKVGSNANTTLQWAEISTVFLILPMLILGVGILAILIILIHVTRHWNQRWPLPLRNIRKKVLHFNQTSRSLVQKPANWMIRFRGMVQGIRSFFNK